MTTRRTVLVVEDDGAMRDMLACLLDSLGYEPSAVADADTALFALRARAFDAVVSDLHMPQRDGFALARALRWVRPGTPLVLMTSFGTKETRAEAERAGAGAFLCKPFSRSGLADAIEAACASARR